MNANEQLYSDVLISWLGAAGVWGYVNFIHHHRTGSQLERNTLFLLYCMFALMFVRGFDWLFHHPVLGYVRFFPTVVLPLAITLFAESLMRRHVGIALKIYVAAGTVFFVAAALTDHVRVNPPVLIGFLVFEVSVILLMALDARRASETVLTAAEARLKNAVVVAALVAAPLVVTDFREELTWIPRRLGAAGALAFVYVFIRFSNRTDTGTVVIAEFMQMMLRAAIVALSFMAIASRLSVRDFFEFFPLALVFVMVFTIFYRLKAIGVENRGASFLSWLMHAKFASLDAYATSLRRLPLMQENIVLKQADLPGYDCAVITRYLTAERRMTSLSALRRTASRSAQAREAAEQLVDILERHGMSHVGLVSQAPLVLLAANCPLIAGSHLEEVKLNVALRLARLVAGNPGTQVAADEIVPETELLVSTSVAR
jgi:hypothetical protein